MYLMSLEVSSISTSCAQSADVMSSNVPQACSIKLNNRRGRLHRRLAAARLQVAVQDSLTVDVLQRLQHLVQACVHARMRACKHACIYILDLPVGQS